MCTAEIAPKEPHAADVERISILFGGKEEENTEEALENLHSSTLANMYSHSPDAEHRKFLIGYFFRKRSFDVIERIILRGDGEELENHLMGDGKSLNMNSLAEAADSEGKWRVSDFLSHIRRKRRDGDRTAHRFQR